MSDNGVRKRAQEVVDAAYTNTLCLVPGTYEGRNAFFLCRLVPALDAGHDFATVVLALVMDDEDLVERARNGSGEAPMAGRYVDLPDPPPGPPS